MCDERKKLVIFSGTTEGRQLSEALLAKGIAHTVCVATAYGEVMQPEDALILVEEGRKDAEEMRRFFSEGTLFVADATHPFAIEASANIRKAAEAAGLPYIRVLREKVPAVPEAEGLHIYDTAEACAEAAEQTEGKLLFTTGSKELAAMCEKLSDLSRVYVRVLPSVKAIELCLEAGVRQDHILAMHGPFSAEMNLATIRQYGISCMISKESGSTGGFDEKLAACRAAGIPCLCIRRPAEEKGLSVEEAEEYLIKAFSGEQRKAHTARILFELVGYGTGDPALLSVEAQKAVRSADLCFGAKRLLETLPEKERYPYYRAEDVLKKLAELLAAGRRIVKAAVLFTGDTGFYSGAGSFAKELTALSGEYLPAYVCEARLHPGISCVSVLAARSAVPYSGAAIISLHGRSGEAEICEAAEKILASEKSFVLFSGGDDVAALAKKLEEKGLREGMLLGRDLSLPGEELRELSLKEAEAVSGKGLYTALIRNPAVPRRVLIPYKEDREFEKDKVPMTKALVRHEAVRLLRLKEGDVLYDVGGGSGSVSIEAAGLSSTLKVYAFEKKAEAAALFERNLKKSGLANVRLIRGEAPEAFSGIEPADAVFIGGSAGRLGDILEALSSADRSIRAVMSAVSLEGIEEMLALRKKPFISGLQIRQLSASNAVEAGSYHIMKTENTVMLASFIMGKKDEDKQDTDRRTE